MYRRFFEGSGSHIEKADLRDDHLQFALRQSNQAISGLLRSGGAGGKMDGVDKITLMTCSVLFGNMACLQGHQRDGLHHLRSGIRMLNEMDREETDKVESHPINVESLRSIFVGLDMQARSIMSSSDVRNWEPMPRTKELAISGDAEINDKSLLEMQQYLQSLLNHTMAFIQGVAVRTVDEGQAVYSDYRQLLARFDNVTIRLEKLCARASYTSRDFSQPLTALQLLHSQLEFFLRSPRKDLDTRFDFMIEPFEIPFDDGTHLTKMMDLAIKLLPHTSSMPPVFTTSIGPLSALWLVATRAPSEYTTLRKRAVRLMLSYPRREGFWDGLVAGQIAQEALRLEQESTQEELGLSAMPNRDLIVPDDLRVVVVALSYDKDDDRKAKVEYRNQRSMAAGEPGKVQCLVW
jgi:hypothetical protein